jgi:hypothetical protein
MDKRVLFDLDAYYKAVDAMNVGIICDLIKSAGKPNNFAREQKTFWFGSYCVNEIGEVVVGMRIKKRD